MTIQDYINKGYCRISNKFGIISRIDRPDWREVMGRDMRILVENLIDSNICWQDHYRRLYSKDRITIDPRQALQIPSSNHNFTEYVS